MVLNIGSPYSLRSSFFMHTNGFQNGLRSTLHDFDNLSDIASVTQKVNEYFTSHHVAHDNLSISFFPYVPRYRNPNFACLGYSFQVRAPPESVVGSGHPSNLHCCWHTQWAGNPHQVNDTPFLDIKSEHTLKADELLYPDYRTQSDSIRYGWPLRGNLGYDAFSAIHPLNHYHRTIYELWLKNKDRNFNCVNEILPAAFKLSEGHRSVLQPTVLRLTVATLLFSDKAEPRPMSETLNKSTAILNLQDYQKWCQSERVSKCQIRGSRAYIALGSNEGDSLASLEKACRAMAEVGIVVERTSGLYETRPMYLTEQRCFMNAVCEVCSCCLETMFLNVRLT